MKTPFRASIGFILGVVLGALAFYLSGAGHGTYAPMVANVSVLAFIPFLGLVIAVFGAPFLWSVYFIVVPAFDSGVKRTVALGLVVTLHLIPGLWLAFEDSAFARALQYETGVLLAYGIALVATMLCLAVFASARQRKS